MGCGKFLFARGLNSQGVREEGGGEGTGGGEGRGWTGGKGR